MEKPSASPSRPETPANPKEPKFSPARQQQGKGHYSLAIRKKKGKSPQRFLDLNGNLPIIQG